MKSFTAVIRPQVGDRVFIGGTHHGYARGKVGKFKGYRGDGRARVRIGCGYWAFVRPQNLRPLLDIYEKEADNGENSRD